MNGPEHYREGERLLTESEVTSTALKPDEAQALATQAQAHFAAALVAAFAQANLPEYASWQNAVSL
jgi:hypothetical protein